MNDYKIYISTEEDDREMVLLNHPREEADEWMGWLSQIDEIVELYLFEMGGKQIAGWTWR